MQESVAFTPTIPWSCNVWRSSSGASLWCSLTLLPFFEGSRCKPSAAVHDLEWIQSPWIDILHHWGKAPECEFFHSHWRQPPHSQPHCWTSSVDSVQRCESWVYECYPSLEVFLLDRPINCTKPRTLNKTEQLIYIHHVWFYHLSCVIVIYHVIGCYIFSSDASWWWTLRDSVSAHLEPFYFLRMQLEHIKTICCILSYNFFTLNMASDML